MIYNKSIFLCEICNVFARKSCVICVDNLEVKAILLERERETRAKYNLFSREKKEILQIKASAIHKRICRGFLCLYANNL